MKCAALPKFKFFRELNTVLVSPPSSISLGPLQLRRESARVRFSAGGGRPIRRRCLPWRKGAILRDGSDDDMECRPIGTEDAADATSCWRRVRGPAPP